MVVLQNIAAQNQHTDAQWSLSIQVCLAWQQDWCLLGFVLHIVFGFLNQEVLAKSHTSAAHAPLTAEILSKAGECFQDSCRLARCNMVHHGTRICCRARQWRIRVMHSVSEGHRCRIKRKPVGAAFLQPTAPPKQHRLFPRCQVRDDRIVTRMPSQRL